MKAIVMVLTELLLFTTLAHSQSPVEVVKEFGLLGTWAYDCDRAPGPANAYASFALTPEGKLELSNTFGPDYDDMVYRIMEATRLSYFRLAMRQALTTDDRVVLDTETMKAGGKIRNWSSRFADGSGTLVEGGLTPSDQGHETGWMTRCDVRRAGRREGRPQPG